MFCFYKGAVTKKCFLSESDYYLVPMEFLLAIPKPGSPRGLIPEGMGADVLEVVIVIIVYDYRLQRTVPPTSA